MTVEQGKELAGYRKLLTWQKADELASVTFQAMLESKAIPRWLTEQLCKAAVSVPANIAEGYSRGSLGDYLRFLDIARGSLGEVEYYIHFMTKNSLLSASISESLSRLLTETGRLLFALIKSLDQKRREGTWDRSHPVRDEAEEYLLEPAE